MRSTSAQRMRHAAESDPGGHRRSSRRFGCNTCNLNGDDDDRFVTGIDAPDDRKPQPKRVWNRIPDDVRDPIIELALDDPDLSPRELAITFTHTKGYFVWEAEFSTADIRPRKPSLPIIKTEINPLPLS